MGSIYIHIPFCKKKCCYCNFHFSTSLKNKAELFKALLKEIFLRKNELKNIPVSAIYFGGGTPSLFDPKEMAALLNRLQKYYTILPFAEITMEINPEDTKENYLKAIKKEGINRVSLGIQSFFDADLKFMNRTHNNEQNATALKNVKKYFYNISIDLIYGTPKSNQNSWKENVSTALQYEIPHLSCYALTVEPKTLLYKQIASKKTKLPNDNIIKKQFDYSVELLKQKGFYHYEISNFGKMGFFSQNNLNYWSGHPYIGIGPSAHSFIAPYRSWNIANNTDYIHTLEKNKLPQSKENISIRDAYNEYIMLRLRTKWGISLAKVKENYGAKYKNYLTQQAQKYLKSKKMIHKNEHLLLTNNGLFLADGIAADLFIVNKNDNN